MSDKHGEKQPALTADNVNAALQALFADRLPKLPGMTRPDGGLGAKLGKDGEKTDVGTWKKRWITLEVDGTELRGIRKDAMLAVGQLVTRAALNPQAGLAFGQTMRQLYVELAGGERVSHAESVGKF